jgi:tRNA1Val (adenine37-N6)-methyltransferase
MRTQQKYDLIISNPPFFASHLKRRQYRQNVALHSESLQLPELAIIVSYLLDKKGSFVVMLPKHEMSIFEEAAAEVKLFPYEKLNIVEQHQGKLIRVITSFSFQEKEIDENVLYIKNEAGTYTDEFIQLLQPYYLNM